jgi:hypothetical protein
VFVVGRETVRTVVITVSTSSIKFSLRSSDPAEVKLRQAQVARQAELHWKALRQTKAAGEAGVALSHQECVALAGRAYRAWASEEARRR